MSPILRFLLFIVLYFNIALALPAQHPFRKADYLGDETGIKSPPTCITEDDKGFFWVGTDDGLYRFDGAHSRQIFYKPEENLGFGRVTDIEYEPATGSLWICSDRGICRYDLNVKTVDRFNPEDYFPKSEIDKGHECIYQDRQGTWWGDFNTKGLTHYSPDNKQADRYVVSESQLRGKGVFSLANTVLAVTQDVRYDSIIWAGTRCGLIRVNKATKTMQYYLYRHPDDALMEASNAMTCLLSHPNGRLYIGTWNGGLLDFDPATQQFRQYFPDPGKFDLIASKNNVYTLLEDGSEAFWVGSSMGIFRFSIPDPGFTLIKKGASLHYKDTKGDFWAFNGKLVRYNRFKNQFPVVPGLTGRVKRFLVNTPGNEIYIKKYDENGVWVLDPDKQTIRRLPFPGKANAAADGDVLEHTALGLLTNNREQLFLLPKDGSNFTPLYTLPSEAGWIFSRTLPNGGAVLTGDRGYLFHFKPGERTPEVYPPAVVGGGITGFQDGLQVLAVDRFGRAWLRTSGGYCIFDSHNQQFLRFPYQNAPDKIFPDISEFVADNKGRMWCIGPEELGWIDQAHPEQGIQQRYDRSTGFYFAPLGALKIDQQGHVWFTCNRGLVQFSPADRSYKIYPANNHAMLFLPDGKLIMSFGDGVSVVHPDSLLAEASQPRPYAAWFKVLDKEIPLPGNLLVPDEIRLRANENFISIGFSLLGFFKPEEYQFAYQLVGVNEDWVQADADNPVAAYTALGGGDYVFRLKVRDALGRWTIQPYELRIHIDTPWYRSWPAWLLYAGLLAWAARLWLRNRDRQLIVRQQLREEQREAERLKDLDTFKNRFFANITHEFRTPLTVILGMTGELEAEVKNEQQVQGLKSKIQRALPFIRRNGQRLLDLVNQMLALSRLDAGALPVQMVRGDIMNQLRILVEAFHSYAVSQKIGLQFHADPENFEMDFDPELMQRIISNLISNALKFTEEYGNVLVSAKSVQEKGQIEYLQIEVRDTGTGIAPEQLPFIFDRFYQAGTAPLRGEESSGIGLALVKEIVTLLHGRIEVASTLERGSTFRVWLPVTRQSEKMEETGPAFIGTPLPMLPLKDTSEASTEGKPLALVIEDNADVLDYIRACLLPDWEVITARNGAAGLAVAQAELPDVIISDVMMPGMDGFGLTEAVKSDLRTSHIPILLLTARSGRADIIEGLSRGADDYLVKPFDKAELLLRLRNFHQQQIRWQNKPAEPEAPDPLPPAERAFLNKVDAAIEAHLDQIEFKAENLARAVALSRVQLHRKLSALAGMSTGLYIRRYRLLRAKHFLATTDLQVSEVAWKVGFENLSWFSQAYREEFGESPSEARR